MKNLIGRLVIPIWVGALLILSACDLPFGAPPPSAYRPPVPTLPSGEDCLVGTWEMNDFGDSIASMLPKSVQYTGTTGLMHWTFTAGGIVEAEADHFALAFAQTDDPSMGITVSLNGTLRRFYKLSAAGEITFWNPDDSEFTWTATMGGVDIPLDPLFKALAPVPPASGVITYKCELLSLTIYPPTTGVQPLGFTKVNP